MQVSKKKEEEASETETEEEDELDLGVSDSGDDLESEQAEDSGGDSWQTSAKTGPQYNKSVWIRIKTAAECDCLGTMFF